MRRVQIQLTDTQVEALRKLAETTDRPVAELVREAVDAWLSGDERGRRIDRALGAIGSFHSGLGNLAEDHDRYLDEGVG